MKEIGGYIELDKYSLPMLHDGAKALNCGRNALAYVIRARGIKKLLLPAFICDSVINVCSRENALMRFYPVDTDLLPGAVEPAPDEWLYLVNYYGQLTNEHIERFIAKYKRVIVDNSQSYFQSPVQGADTLYTARKYFGVADGAFLYTDARLEEDLPVDESFDRMRFLLGRFERGAGDFYDEYRQNNAFFENEPIKRMSRLTENLLRGIDYEAVRSRRESNFKILHDALLGANALDLRTVGTFMYPFLAENGAEIRKRLIEKRIYIPMLWPGAAERCGRGSTEARLAENILPLPIDQRYGEEEMKLMIGELLQ